MWMSFRIKHSFSTQALVADLGWNHQIFFYSIVDKSTDFNTINKVTVKVSSNELEHGPISMATLGTRQIDGSVDEVDFHFLANDCKTANTEDCMSDRSIEVKIRLYDIDVKVTDAFGRSSEDKCHIIIVPNCDYKYDDNCVSLSKEHLKYHGDEIDKHDHIKKSKRDKKYYSLEYLSDLASQSSIRRDVTSLQLVYDFDVAPSNNTVSRSLNEDKVEPNLRQGSGQERRRSAMTRIGSRG